jgi:NAD(P)-dependent dehydrogenase (short-subunit alcohol dehydrogenase family)
MPSGGTVDVFEDKVAIVIGGHSGIGAAVAEELSGQGALVVVAGRRADLVRAAASRLGGEAITCDITSDAEVQHLVQATLARAGRLDIVVNCAGYQQSTALRDLTADSLAAMHAVQLTGALSVMRHGCNAMADGGGGAFMSISSQTAHSPALGLAAYGSAKAGLEHATRIAAVEYGPAGVRVNAVAAGLTRTPMTEPIFQRPGAVETVLEVTPLRRLPTVTDIANAVVFLVGPHAAAITGQILPVDGGGSLQMLPSPQMYADVARRRSRS